MQTHIKNIIKKYKNKLKNANKYENTNQNKSTKHTKKPKHISHKYNTKQINQQNTINNIIQVKF